MWKETPARRWAQRRNRSKFQLKGIKGQLTYLLAFGMLTGSEKMEIRHLRDEVKELLKFWDSGNEDSKRRYVG